MLEEPTRPLVCLVMILKNEAHTIATTLRSVRDHVDCYHILDTGSTDGTARVIAEHMKGLNGGVYNATFIDYGATRNRILEIVAALPIDERPVFTLMLSADEVVRNAAHMRAFLADMRYAFGSMHGATPVVMRMSNANAANSNTAGTVHCKSLQSAPLADSFDADH